MKKTTFVLTVMLMMGLMAHADTETTIIQVGDTTQMTLSAIIAKNLPVLYVETVEHEEPTCEYVSAPSGCMGKTIHNATKVPGRLVIYKRIDGVDSVLYDSGDYEKDVSGMTIKLRGNTSAYDVKKPYKIKLQKKFDLLFGGNESVYKDKEWLLLRDDYLTTIAGFKASELVGMIWTPRHHFVNVILNGSYRGAYLLCESVKRNPDCRLNVDKNSGFIFENDPYWWNEDVYVLSNRNPSYNYTFKYPDSDDITEEQLAYMQALVRTYEQSVTAGTYTDYIDVESFAAWCLVHDVMGTKDSGGTNRYYTKYDTTAESKIFMPLAWDFDMAERTASEWSRSHISHMNTFFNSRNREFVGEFADLWRKIRNTLLNDYKNYLTEFRLSEEGVALNNSFALDKLVYGRSLSVYSYVTGRISWMTSRQPWLDNAIMTMNPLGDVNVDGQVNLGDLVLLIDALLANNTDSLHAADANKNGHVDIGDVSTIVQMLLAE